MSSFIRSFLKGQDQLGSTINVHHKGSPTFGTMTGGCVSLTVTIFFTVFILIQLYSFYFEVSYNQFREQKYLPALDTPAYDVDVQEFLPIFFVLSVPDNKTRTYPITYNDQELWEWSWTNNVNGNDVDIASINCRELVESWTDLEVLARQRILDEIPEPAHALCPNIDYFNLGGTGKSTLEFRLKPTQLGRSFSGKSYFTMAEMDRYVDPKDFNENGIRSALGNVLFKQEIDTDGYQVKSIWVSLINENLFNFAWIDTSSIDIFDLAQSWDAYKVTHQESSYISARKGIKVTFEQSRMYIHEIIAIKSLDVLLGLVGGFSSIVWGTLFLIFGSYEDFKLNNSLIGAIYPTSPSRLNTAYVENPEEPAYLKEYRAKRAVVCTVADRGKYFYTYSEYLLSKIIVSCCVYCCTDKSCFKLRKQRLQRHKEAKERLTGEVDLARLLYVQRISNFLSKLFLNKHQRALVTSFKHFQLDDLEQSEQDYTRKSTLFETSVQGDQTEFIHAAFEYQEHNPYLTGTQHALIEEINEHFKPKESDIDLGILFEITGYQSERVEPTFWDNYDDFDVLQVDSNKFVRLDKDEEHPLTQKDAIATQDEAT